MAAAIILKKSMELKELEIQAAMADTRLAVLRSARASRASSTCSGRRQQAAGTLYVTPSLEGRLYREKQRNRKMWPASMGRAQVNKGKCHSAAVAIRSIKSSRSGPMNLIASPAPRASLLDFHLRVHIGAARVLLGAGCLVCACRCQVELRSMRGCRYRVRLDSLSGAVDDSCHGADCAVFDRVSPLHVHGGKLRGCLWRAGRFRVASGPPMARLTLSGYSEEDSAPPSPP